jgi:uncharacterized protein involved in exopolysaccharide biosynthesis/Mrp family chromosome partitioning ATPase
MTISTFPPDRLPLASMHHESRFQVETKSDEFDLGSGLRIIRRRIVMIGALVTLFTGASLATIWDLKPSYRAESRLIIHKPLATTLSAEEAGRNEPLDLRSETERLLSRSVAERVIRDLHLDQRPEFNPALREVSLFDKARRAIRGLIDGEQRQPPEQSSVEPIIPEYYGALRVWRDGLGDVIQIGFEATDPELAAAAPNQLISVYLEERNDSIRRRLDKAEEWIRQRIEEQRNIADKARAAADSYRETMGVVLKEESLGEQLKSQAELNDRQGKIAQNRADTVSAIATLETADDPSLALTNISLPENIAAMAEDFRTQQRDLYRLLDTYDDGAQAVIDLRASIEKSRADLGQAVGRYLQSLRARLAALNQEYAVVRSDLAAADEKRSRAALAQSELTRLERTVDREETTLDKLEALRRGLAGQAMLPGTEVEVLSPAAVPIGPQGRGRLFYLIGAMLASASIAITAAVLIEMLDKRVRSFDQLNGMPRMIPAGYVPRLKRKNWWNPARTRSLPDGEFDDAIHGLANALKQSNGGTMPASILVTGPQPSGGSSLVARSLAIQFVSSGSKVLLVDAGTPKGNLDRFFKCGLKQGLKEFLRGQTTIGDIIHHDPRTGVDFIPAGNTHLNRRRPFTGIADIVALARSRGQTVIFVAAPATRSTETFQLSSLVDQTLLVVDWATTSRSLVELNMRQLRGPRSNEILIAINDVNVRRHALYNFGDSDLLLGTPL